MLKFLVFAVKLPAIQKYLEDELAELIIGSSISQGDTISVTYMPGAEKLTAEVVHPQ